MRVKLYNLIAKYRDGGIKSLARSLARSVCDYQIQEFRGRIIADQDPPFTPNEHDNGRPLVCTVITPGASLQPFAAEFTLPFRDSFETLERRLAQGCVLIFGRRPLEVSRYEVVGYSIMEAGVFSAAGVHGKIPQDIMFVHYTEVTRKYRGQRIAERISRARNDYYRANGIRRSCNAHSPSNITSERAFRKFGSDLLCYIVRITFFRGLVVWHTPFKRIEAAIGKLDRQVASATSSAFGGVERPISN